MARVEKRLTAFIFQDMPNASCNMDTTACRQLQLLSSLTEKLYQELHKQKLWKIFVDMEMKLLPILAGLLLHYT
jgi:DNA polymerase I-like protein with 3'-5' exonuclease and polymerase domains